MLGDKISIDGAETTVIGCALFQSEAPHFYHVTDSAGVDLRVEWRRGVWGLQGRATFAPKPAIRPPREAKSVKSWFQPTKEVGKYAPKIELRPDIIALHVSLDEARDKYNLAKESGNADRMETAWPEYEKLMLEVDRRDPGWFLGRTNPLTPWPRTNYAEKSAYMHNATPIPPSEPEIMHTDPIEEAA
jgi:hypothetical protein